MPQLYQLQSAQGATEYLAAVSQKFTGMQGGPAIDFMALQPDRTRIQLLDVRDPANVSQAWEIEIDGWLRASRKIGNTLYLVNSYRPRLPGIRLPSDSPEAKRANELRVRTARASELLPHYRVNGADDRQLVTAGDCVLPAGSRRERRVFGSGRDHGAQPVRAARDRRELHQHQRQRRLRFAATACTSAARTSRLRTRSSPCSTSSR